MANGKAQDRLTLVDLQQTNRQERKKMYGQLRQNISGISTTNSDSGISVGGQAVEQDPNISTVINTIKWKEPARATTTVNGTLATAYENGDTIDGVVLVTGDRILIKDQSTGSENGVYVVEATGYICTYESGWY